MSRGTTLFRNQPTAKMEKEMLIIFVYDTKRCQREEDDPQDAVLYFHPPWVSDQQRLALCGQLMGAAQFLMSMFSHPRILALDSGKFVMRTFGRYVLAVGSDRNIPDWVLEHRAKILQDMVKFYHKDLETVSSTINDKLEEFVEKLNQMFETYLPILQFAADIFGTIPLINLPKSASNVFLEALHILHSFQGTKGILGGAVFYQDKVVSTQLSPSLTKILVSTDPYHIKIPAEPVSTPFHLPVGVQLMYVYLEGKEFHSLLQEAAKARLSLESIAEKKKTLRKTPQGKVPPPHKEQLGGMKRDVSRIFTVPEEKEGEADLRAQSVSTCPTPSKDINVSRVLHEKSVSICKVKEADLTGTITAVEPELPSLDRVRSENLDVQKNDDKLDKRSMNSPNFVVTGRGSDVRSLSMSDLNLPPSRGGVTLKAPAKYYSLGAPRLARESHEDDESPDPKFYAKKRLSYTITDPMFPVFRSDGLPVSHSLYDEHLASHYQLLGQQQSSEHKCPEERVSVRGEGEGETATAISAPAGAPTGGPGAVSASRRALSLPLKGLTAQPCTSKEAKTLGNLQLTPLMSKLALLAVEDSHPITPSEEQPALYEEEESRLIRKRQSLPAEEQLEEPSPVQQEDDDDDSTSQQGDDSPSIHQDEPSSTQYDDDASIQQEDKKSPFTQGEDKESIQQFEEEPASDQQKKRAAPSSDNHTNPSQQQVTCGVAKQPHTQQNLEHKIADKREGTLQKLAMFVFGQQNMGLMLFMEESLSKDDDLIFSVWQRSLNSLNLLEKHLRQSLEHFPHSEGSESYGHLCVDPAWDLVQRGGLWGAMELGVVTSLHHDFSCSPGLTEAVIRCEDSTVYGYHCAKTEVFYHQSSGNSGGLPTPSDLLGTVPLKARRRLERDHGIILL